MEPQAITAEQMAALDRVMAEEFGVDASILMEHAGVAVANAASKMALGNILVLAGHGNNGGDGMVAARHLHNWGYDVEVLIPVEKEQLKEHAKKQAAILEQMGVRIKYGASLLEGDNDIIIDALLGYNLTGAPRDNYAALIDAANASECRILSVDVPSGLDATTGVASEHCIKAHTTVTLCVAKTGLLKSVAKEYVGRLIVSYLSVPSVVYKKFGLKNPFAIEEMKL